MVDTLPAWVQLAIVMLAAARITVLVVSDRITQKPREWLIGHEDAAGVWHPGKLDIDSYPAYLFDCPLCSGFWIAAALALPWIHWPVGTTLVGLPFAVAMGAWWAGDWRND